MHVQVTIVREIFRGHSSGQPQLYAVEIDYAGRSVVIELPAYFVQGDVGATVDLDMAQAMDDLAEALQNRAVLLRSLHPSGHP